MSKKGKIVKMKSGKLGIAYDNMQSNKLKKIVVTSADGKNYLCEASTLTIIGFTD